MSTTSLQILLSRYVMSGDEDAFAEVVRASGPLVWRVAMRRLNDPQLAEEAAQNVFLIMARKAPALCHRSGLLAWLHRAATLEASTLARSRRRREQRLSAMARDTIPPDAQRLSAPHPGAILDEAINRLNADERMLIIGRFYEDRPLRDLAAELGKSEEAAKKQAQRALGKLECLLRGRGIGVTGTALVTLLGAELSAAALPGHLTSSLVSSSLSALGKAIAQPSISTSIIAIMSSAKMTVTAAGLLVILLAASARQGHLNAALRRDLAKMTASVAAPTAETLDPSSIPSPARTGPALAETLDPLPHPLDAVSLLRAMARSNPTAAGLYDPGPDITEAQRVIEAMTPSERWELWTALESAGGSADLLRLAGEWVLLHLIPDNPQRVLDLAVDRRLSGHTRAYMQTWASENPDAAWRWLSQAGEAGRLLRTRSGGEAPEDVLKRGFAEGLANRKLDDAVEFTRRHLADDGAEWLVAGTGAILMNKRDHARLLELAAGLPTDAARIRALVEAARVPLTLHDVTWATRHVGPLLDRPDFPAHLRQTVLREVAATAQGDWVWPSILFVHQASPPEQLTDNLGWLVDRFAKERASQLASTVTLGDPAQQQALDAALAATALAMRERGNARLAREFANKVRDTDLRTQMLTEVTP